MNDKKTCKPCELCKKPFERYISQNKKFCSVKCRALSAHKSVNSCCQFTCEQCGFVKISNHHRRHRFCSRKCLYAWMHEHSPQKRPREMRQCKVCSHSFEEFVHKSRQICSQACYHKSRVGSTLTPEHRQIISKSRKRDWANGTTYANARVGRVKWHDHTKPNGELIRLQGTWEVLYAKHLDATGVTYQSHQGALWYTRSGDGSDHVYLPDFYLIDADEYVDVKNDYLLKIDRQKLEDVKTCNPTITLRIVTKADLINLRLMN